MSYVPSTETEQVKWLNNFVLKLPAHIAGLGLSTGDSELAQADAAQLAYQVNVVVPAFKSGLQERVAYKNLLKNGPMGAPTSATPVVPTLPLAPPEVAPGIMPRVLQLIGQIKAAPGYTEAIGRDLAIIGAETVQGDAGPAFTAKAQPGSQVLLEFAKGAFDGVSIESQGAGGNWELLAVDRYSPYADTRPAATPGQPEVRSYRMRYLDHDDPTGDYSDTVTVTTTP